MSHRLAVWNAGHTPATSTSNLRPRSLMPPTDPNQVLSCLQAESLLTALAWRDLPKSGLLRRYWYSFCFCMIYAFLYWYCSASSSHINMIHWGIYQYIPSSPPKPKPLLKCINPYLWCSWGCIVYQSQTGLIWDKYDTGRLINALSDDCMDLIVVIIIFYFL